MFYPVIMAGGGGARLWPLSRKNTPKQCINLFGNSTLVEQTYDRISDIYPDEKIFISTNIKYVQFLQDKLPISSENYIIEPAKRDTAAAIGLLTAIIHKKNPNACIITLASDHFIQDIKTFQNIVQTAQSAIEQYPNNLITIGIVPTYPETGYGYIEKGELYTKINNNDIFKVKSFKEKPDTQKAIKFITSGNFLWNAGIFIFNTSYILDMYKKHLPQTYEILQSIADTVDNENFNQILNEKYPTLPESIPFDIAIVEKLSDIIVIPGNFGWSDIGNWKALKGHTSKPQENYVIGNNINIDSENCLIYNNNENKIIATIGLTNIAIVDTPDALLVADLDKVQDVKKIQEQIDEKYR